MLEHILKQWDIVIGIETHVQLSTVSKIFSRASTAFGAQPNTQASLIDLALPGTLPIFNKQALYLAAKFGLATSANIHTISLFDRKHYFYPDLPKGYQTTQLYQPIVTDGLLNIDVDGQSKTIKIVRAHLEEDAGKSLHEDFHGQSGIDLNRAGTPLLEIVTGPDLNGPQEAVAYAKTLHTLVRWIGISDGNMQEGSFRCDANVSLKPKGSDVLGTRCEIKNLNSFKFLEEAICAEVIRQAELLEDGKTIAQQTRLYDPDKQETRAMRSKEDAQDYRYFPCPDLMPVHISQETIDTLSKQMPELPQAFKQRLLSLGLSVYDANILSQDVDTANYFNDLVANGAPAKLASNWIGVELFARLNKAQLAINHCPVQAQSLAQIIDCIGKGTINHKTGQQILDMLWQTPEQCVLEYIEKQGLAQISDSNTMQIWVDEILNTQVKLVEEYLAGKEKAFNAMVGQIMKLSKGKANPAQVNDLLLASLNRLKS